MGIQQPVAVAVDRVMLVRHGSRHAQCRCFGTGNDLAIRRVRKQGGHDGVRIMNVKTQKARNMSVEVDMQKRQYSLLPAKRS
ncbi:hypothetical protein [Burkholderia stagnalis]|uniref:hypothetical protein n=1 Tax=Burkholderia stagnalis TaxID=1503054 RepID=UPI000A67A925|nr:hypothetical protein [Burkholderia stagnalis]